MEDKRVVIDIETIKTYDEVGGRDHLDQLGVSVVGVYDYATSSYRIFEANEMGPLQNFLINASLVIGFNHVGFDLPVLQSHLTIDVKTIPTFDIMLDIQQRLGHRVSLDSVAKATLGEGKTGHGLDAIRFYREGRMQELKDYCLNDVRVTKEVFDHGVNKKKIFYLSKLGNQKKELPVDWKPHANSLPDFAPLIPAQYKLF